jgi:hypothetical protein
MRYAYPPYAFLSFCTALLNGNDVPHGNDKIMSGIQRVNISEDIVDVAHALAWETACNPLGTAAFEIIGIVEPIRIRLNPALDPM